MSNRHNVDVDKLLDDLQALSDNTGVYCISTPDYKERTDFMEGWNFCVANFYSKIDDCIDNAKKPYDKFENFISNVSESTGLFYKIDDKWFVMLNDTWYFATADLEEIPKEDMKKVMELFLDYGMPGVYFWVWTKRKEMPQIEETKMDVEGVRDRMVQKELEYYCNT